MIGRALALAVGLLSGLVFSQGPEFAQQYRQRLGGAIDELRRVVVRFDETAQASGLTREDAITKLQSNPERLVQSQGEAQSEIVRRLGRLEAQRRDFEQAGPFQRLLVMVRGADPGLARATYLDFEPAWPATSEGLVAGGIGFLTGWLVLIFGARTASRLNPMRLRRPRMREA